MHLSITSLNSGSNGNCYYIGNEKEAVLIDAGISCRETENRMKRLGLSMYKVKAIFVSHEHSDHIRGIPVLAKKYRLPVYITYGTLQNSKLDLSGVMIEPFRSYEPVQIGGISVTAFPKLHDARDPHSFIVDSNNIKVGVFTDIGAPCNHVIDQFRQCHAAFLEANYDDGLLDRSFYPYHLKQRIRGGEGHLSNEQALNLFTTHKSDFLSHLVLSHLSKNNNCPRLVKDLFTLNAGDTEIIVASRYEETPVFEVGSSRKPQLRMGVQMSLLLDTPVK